MIVGKRIAAALWLWVAVAEAVVVGHAGRGSADVSDVAAGMVSAVIAAMLLTPPRDPRG